MKRTRRGIAGGVASSRTDNEEQDYKEEPQTKVKKTFTDTEVQTNLTLIALAEYTDEDFSNKALIRRNVLGISSSIRGSRFTGAVPRKPLTAYMRYSKSIWQPIKEANPSLSVCEIGATIGRMWRELVDTEKQKYIQEFVNDKMRYDLELKNASPSSSEVKQSHASPSPQPPATQNTVVQQITGQALIGVPPMLQTCINEPVPVMSAEVVASNPGLGMVDSAFPIGKMWRDMTSEDR